MKTLRRFSVVWCVVLCVPVEGSAGRSGDREVKTITPNRNRGEMPQPKAGHGPSSQRLSWWDPTTSCAERVREPWPKRPTQEPAQGSLAAEGFDVLVVFQNVSARLENVRSK